MHICPSTVKTAKFCPCGAKSSDEAWPQSVRRAHSILRFQSHIHRCPFGLTAATSSPSGIKLVSVTCEEDISICHRSLREDRSQIIIESLLSDIREVIVT